MRLSPWSYYTPEEIIESNMGTVIDIIMELDSSTASSRDKGLLIEAVQRIMRESD